MPNASNDSRIESDTTQQASNSFSPPSTLRYDLVILALTAFTGLLGGIVITLAYLSPGEPELLWLLGVLLALAALAVFLLRARARARQRAALTEWTRQMQKRLDQSTTLAAQQHTQIQLLETKIAGLEQRDAPATIPVIRGWHALDLPEQELAPQLQILAALFRGQSQIFIQKKFSGGHRNRGVYLIRSFAEADRIVKIARSSDIRAERQAQEWINRFSQNNGAQYVRGIVSSDDAAPGGIVYRLTALRRNSDISSLETFYRATPQAAACARVVEQLYEETLPHSEFRRQETVALFREHALPERALQRIENALLEIPALSQLTRADSMARIEFGARTYAVMNPLSWAAHEITQYQDAQLEVMCGVIHGDLHSGNVLVETAGQALWLIDFAKTRPHAHTLLDFARMEADLKFFLVGDENADYARVLQLEEQLLAPRGIGELEPSPEIFRAYDEELQKAGACLAALRRVAIHQHAEEPHHGAGHFIGASALPYYLALWHSTMRTLQYTQCSAQQKTYAFLSAAMLCERITQLMR